MSQALSPSFARCYGLARVARVWKIARASVYRSLKEKPPNTSARRPGPVGGGTCNERWSGGSGSRGSILQNFSSETHMGILSNLRSDRHYRHPASNGYLPRVYEV